MRSLKVLSMLAGCLPAWFAAPAHAAADRVLNAGGSEAVDCGRKSEREKEAASAPDKPAPQAPAASGETGSAYKDPEAARKALERYKESIGRPPRPPAADR